MNEENGEEAMRETNSTHTQAHTDCYVIHKSGMKLARSLARSDCNHKNIFVLNMDYGASRALIEPLYDNQIYTKICALD